MTGAANPAARRGVGVALLALVALALVEILRINDTWSGARLLPLVVTAALLGLAAAHLLGASAAGAASPAPAAEPRHLGSGAAVTAGLIPGKKIRGLAVVYPTRLPGFPDVPTVKEAGFPTLDVTGWHGISGPPKLPREIVARWAALLEAAAKDPVFLERAEKLYEVVAIKSPEAFWQFQQEELKRYLPMATQLGIRK